MVFWAGILQAQMCVLDLEEELEKTEGLRAELRCCIPTAPADLPTFPSSPVGPRNLGLLPSPPPDADEASEDDSSGPEGEPQKPAWPREGTLDLEPRWPLELLRGFQAPRRAVGVRVGAPEKCCSEPGIPATVNLAWGKGWKGI